ncbi:NADP-dependent succinate-semialdehyde dehydrogenase [Sneathiella chinensis]|uniref:NAD-dependent succinate-semialdehyde dehydrogenase n=1 Tax=Sneathiella chinensis TaxID=349750 RepID=A0ABQ5U5M7_9PROT|nr:NADP-dependent succinate-semialdehyde dehydrogenase [Sneathiella chinensis]GLQ07018.1 NAD-dependent succinate-semialdehyde dehydrogenase [Sneathiella chinensis]
MPTHNDNPLNLQDPGLFRQQCLIDGVWCDADNGKVVEVTNPATGELLGHVPEMGEAETRRAIAAAKAAMPEWAGKTAKERANILRKWYELMLENTDDLARLMTMEMGKPLAEAKGEVAYAASFIEWFAEEGKRIYGDTIPEHQSDKRIIVLKQPIGVTVAITPWNFPVAMITRKAAPALAAGCPMVIKPAELTPFSAFAMAVLAERAGIPKGILGVVTGVPQDIGREMTGNPDVAKLTFTGSTATGRLLMEQCASTVKKTSMELGGNAPFIVFDDADLDDAVEAALASKYRNAGQTCVCANRLYIQDGVYEAFAAKLAERVKSMKVGNGLEDGVEQGPLITEAAVRKVEDHIADALSKGAKVLTGGKRHALGQTFFEPTILTDATTDMKVAREETFGPMAPLFRFKDEDEVIRLANDTEFGLAAYVCARDIGRVWRVSEKLEYGIVGINTGIISTEVAPFGGVKQSGIGREGSRYGIDDYLEIKYMCLGGLDK